MIRVVLETSVLVSAVMTPTGLNAQVFDLVTAGKVRAYLTEAVLAEYYRVFDYERLQHLDRRRIARLRGLLEKAGVKVKSRGLLKISGHVSFIPRYGVLAGHSQPRGDLGRRSRCPRLVAE